MCRIRFGLAGIHFEDFEICHTVEEVYHPLSSSVPCVVASKSTSTSGVLAPLSKEGYTSEPRGPFSSCDGDDLRNSPLVSSPLKLDNAIRSGNFLLDGAVSDPSSPQNGDGQSDQRKDRLEKCTTSRQKETTQPIPSQTKVTGEAVKPKITSKKAAKLALQKKATSSDGNSNTQQEPLKSGPLTKQVRFSDMVEENIIPKESFSDSGSSSSYDSNIDPAPPAANKLAAPHRTTMPQGTSSTALYDWNSSSSSSSGSGIDAATALGSSPTTTQGRSLMTTMDRSKTPMSQSWDSSSCGSNVDFDGQDYGKSRFDRQRAMSPFSFADSRCGRRTRSIEGVPEPIFVMRSKQHEYVTGEKGEKSTAERETSSRLSLQGSKAASSKQQNKTR